MSTPLAVPRPLGARPTNTSPLGGVGLAVGLLALAAAAALLAGWVPVAFSMATVFLFAGPHNWLESRYFLERLPAKAGKLWPFFAAAGLGVVGLTAGFAALPWLYDAVGGGEEGWDMLMRGWQTLFVGWVLLLVQMRAGQNPRREWGWTYAVAFALLAVVWLAPRWFSIGLVYAHPMMALWVLDRELRRSRPAWQPAYRTCLCLLPVFVVVLWWHLASAGLPMAEGDPEYAIARHAGAEVVSLPGVSDRLLIATHTFLEMVHYGVWIVAIPLIGLRTAPWRLDTIPLARRSPAFRAAVAALLVVGLGVAVLLWVCFAADYWTTRHVYFTVALAHVLAEVPFLLRAL